MKPKPMVYICCLPRSGITTLCFIHGCIGYLSLILFLLQFLVHPSAPDSESKRSESLYFKFECIRILLFLSISTIYFYASYLLYKKKVLLLRPFIKIFKSSIILSTVIALFEFYEFVKFAMRMGPIYEEEETKEEPSFQIKLVVVASYAFFYITFCILPLLNEMYLFRKLHQYMEYIEAKKNDIKQNI